MFFDVAHANTITGTRHSGLTPCPCSYVRGKCDSSYVQNQRKSKLKLYAFAYGMRANTIDIVWTKSSVLIHRLYFYLYS